MIPLQSPAARIFVACDPVDGLKSFDSALNREPMEGSVFVFRNKTGHRARCLVWDRCAAWPFLGRISCAWHPPREVVGRLEPQC